MSEHENFDQQVIGLARELFTAYWIYSESKTESDPAIYRDALLRAAEEPLAVDVLDRVVKIGTQLISDRAAAEGIAYDDALQDLFARIDAADPRHGEGGDA
jgi:hypothetical protein